MFMYRALPRFCEVLFAFAFLCIYMYIYSISAYVDEFLRPLAEKLPSYIKDTTDFISCLKSLGKIPKDCYLVTLDVSSLYTNIDRDVGLQIVEQELEQQNQTHPTARTITKPTRESIKNE